MYKFRIASPEEAKELRKYAYGGEWIYGATTEEIYALFLGKVMSRFGKNDSLSDDWENMYSYDVVAEDEQGNELLLEVYHGPGGPSVALPIESSGIDTAPYKQAMAELVEYIESAEPVDYEHECVYYDIPVNTKYTVKDGIAKVESELPEELMDGDFDPEAFM